MSCGRIKMPPKIELIPINSEPNPWAVWESRNSDMNPWPRNVNTPRLKVMNNQYKKNFPASTAKPTVKYHRRQNTNDERRMKGISTKVNARVMALWSYIKEALWR
mmetsp:Transcript_41589/g.88614  ORF Transcript_41589/g.88614 Transcript_41589/m.88614 type:complete len:105 (-) Transcript_41589:600-914(-)